jgi:hypothetical protein
MWMIMHDDANPINVDEWAGVAIRVAGGSSHIDPDGGGALGG